MTTETQQSSKVGRLPEWFKTDRSKRSATQKLSSFLEAEIPNSICQEAKCPNRSECWAKGVLTFMILGTVCTRACGFCSVKHGKPAPPDLGEIESILKAIEKLDLKFVVMTSPNRDDLPDGGASHYASVIRAIREKFLSVKIEVLIPDFKGKEADLRTVFEAGPDVINHNIETVKRLYTRVRKGSLYPRSLNLLKTLKTWDSDRLTKTGIMLGLGETREDLLEAFKDIRDAGVDILTLGQYLKPDRESLDIERYYTPQEFEELGKIAEEIGIPFVFSGPSVRSSFLADHVFDKALLTKKRNGFS